MLALEIKLLFNIVTNSQGTVNEEIYGKGPIVYLLVCLLFIEKYYHIYFFVSTLPLVV